MSRLFIRRSGARLLRMGGLAAVLLLALDPCVWAGTLVSRGSTWRYRRGTAEASDPRSDWRAVDFDDSSWASGRAPMGYGDAPYGTTLTDMQNSYVTVFLRKTFTVSEADLGTDARLRAAVDYDDGFILWLNGERIWDKNEPDGDPLYDSLASGDHESGVYETNDIAEPGDYLELGENVLAVQVFNAGPGSSDCKIDVELSTYQRVADTEFSHDRGFYDSPFVCTISTATLGATIRYTLDGSDPRVSGNAGSGLSPLAVAIDPGSGTRRLVNGAKAPCVVLRACGLKGGYAATDADTQTYLFLTQVLQQPNCMSGENWLPGDVTSTIQRMPQKMDTGMDPDVVNDPRYSGRMIASLKAVPTMSLAMDYGDMFGDSWGILHNGRRYGREWERPASLELILPDGATGFQVDCGVKISGAYSRTGGKGKNSWSIQFRSEYGASRLPYALFPDSGADSFDEIRLRAQGNDQFAGHSQTNAAYIDDEFGRWLQRRMGWNSPSGTWMHLYINGMYWGLYNPVEVPCADFMQTHYGGEKEGYDVLAQRKNSACIPVPPEGLPRLIDGSETVFHEMHNWITNHDMSVLANFEQARDYLDITQHADYCLIEMWAQNYDWDANQWKFNAPYGSNWRCGRRSRPGELAGRPQFHYFVWDIEVGFDAITEDPTHMVGIGHLHGSLRASAEYRLLWADRIYRHMLQQGGALTPAVMSEQWRVLTNQVQSALIAESARWGDAAQDTPSTVDDCWVPLMTDRLNTLLPQRGSHVLSHFRNAGLYVSSVSPPAFTTEGGAIASGFRLTLSNPNSASTVYYTLDGSDPRLPGGSKSANRIEYAGAFLLSRTTHVKARVYKANGTWSALHEATFNFTAHYANLRITEIHYNPLGGGDFEFIEVKNTGASIRGLSAMTFKGVQYTFPAGTELAGGEMAVLAGNAAVFTNRYSGVAQSVAFFGEYLGRLDNGGERVALLDSDGRTVTSVRYNDRDPWPREADGAGFSLVALTTDGDQDDPAKWRASNLIGGSPGYDDGEPYRVLINEVLSHTDLPQKDAIELYNAGSTSVDIGGWYLSDSENACRKFRIPDATSLAAGGYIVFDEDDFNTDT
ncbi:MAG: lamin tail domain-containing protein, partial [Kiritimatiellae bacterium]|nr:lamin tail domain-containing protein [Kiritimatiellia bacterium]